MVITCLNYDALDIHSCLTTQGVYSSITGLVVSLAILAIKFMFTKYALNGAWHEWQRWLDKHPLRRINFWHRADRHPARNIYVCEDGECKMVELP